MKKLFIAMLCMSIAGISNAQDKKDPVKAATPAATPVDKNAGIFKFKEETHNFGEVKEGPDAECDFAFTNTGKSPIVITEAHGSCGCTVPQWPKDPILPGKSGMIHVNYHTTGRVGTIMKDVYITSNAQQSPMTLHITGNVLAKPAEEQKKASENAATPDQSAH